EFEAHRGVYYAMARLSSGAPAVYSIQVNFTPDPTPNDAEINDATQTANVLVLDATSTGHIGYVGNGVQDSIDWYVVTLPDNGNLTLDLVFEKPPDVELDLYDSDGTTSRGSSHGTSSVERIVSNLAQGDYYVQVRATPGNGVGYQLHAALANPEQLNDPEDNGIPGSAVDLPLDSPSTGHLGFVGNGTQDGVDWYRVTLDRDAYVTFDFQFVHPPDMELDVYNSDGTVHMAAAHSTSNNEQIELALQPGVYLVRLLGRLYSGVGYQFIATTVDPLFGSDPEPNDAFAAANLLPLNSAQPGHLGFRNATLIDQADFWYVDMPSAGRLDINFLFSHPPDLELDVFDSGGNTIHTSHSTSDNERVLIEDAAAGRYYIKLFGSALWGLTYHVSATSQDTPPPTATPVLPDSPTPTPTLPPTGIEQWRVY
ncbi:MAG: hypothetical protein ABIH23_11230, partial [bacterium]